MPRQALGRGLSALLGDDSPVTSQLTGTANEIDIDLIQPNPQQPRTRFTEAALEELAQSIAANGVVQPIVVRPKAKGTRSSPASVVGEPLKGQDFERSLPRLRKYPTTNSLS